MNDVESHHIDILALALVAAGSFLGGVAYLHWAGGTLGDVAYNMIFLKDLADYAAMNEVYRTYFTGPMPARAFLGAGSVLAGAHFEVMGIAVRPK